MESFKNLLELIIFLASFGGIVYHVATIEARLYKSIDTTCDIVGEKISYLEKQLEIHISEYQQQVFFNKEISQHFQQDIDEKFEHLYVILNDYKDICKQFTCSRRINTDENSD